MAARTINIAALVLSVACLSACGVILSAVTVPDVRQDMTQTPGLHYQLHDTAVGVSIPVKATTVSGKLRDFANCLESCSNTCKLQPPVTSFTGYERPTLSSGASAETFGTVLRVSPRSTGPFQTLEHAFDWDEKGSLSATSRAQNDTGTVVVGAATEVLKYALSSPAAAVATPEYRLMNEPHRKPLEAQQALRNYLQQKSSCKGVAIPANGGTDRFRPFEQAALRLSAKVRSDQDLTCGEAQCIAEALTIGNSEIQRYRDAEEAALDPKNWTTSSSFDQIKEHVAFAERQIAALNARIAGLMKALGMDAHEAERTVTLLPRREVRPAAFSAFPSGDSGEPCIDNSFMWHKTQWCALDLRAEGPADADPAIAEEVLKQVRQRAIFLLRIEPTPPVRPAETLASSGQSGRDAGPQGGYQYRLPAHGRVTVVRLDPPQGDAAACRVDADKCVGVPMLVGSVLIGQYSPTVALPAEFSGSDANVEIKLSAEGIPTRVKFGQKARAASEVVAPLTEVLGAAADARDKRQQAAKEAADAAKQAPLNAVKDQNAILKEQIELTKSQRCKKALEGLPDDAALPDACKD